MHYDEFSNKIFKHWVTFPIKYYLLFIIYLLLKNSLYYSENLKSTKIAFNYFLNYLYFGTFIYT